MTPHTVVLMAALTALFGLTCALFKMIRSAEGQALRRAWAQRARWDRARLNRLERGFMALAEAECAGLDAAGGPSCRCGPVSSFNPLPAFDQMLGELRRLDRQRLGGVTQQSEQWAQAVVGAYDRWLQVACTYLSVSHHLSCLTDSLDREIERVRVEAELVAAGLPPIRPS